MFTVLCLFRSSYKVKFSHLCSVILTILGQIQSTKFQLLMTPFIIYLIQFYVMRPSITSLCASKRRTLRTSALPKTNIPFGSYCPNLSNNSQINLLPSYSLGLQGDYIRQLRKGNQMGQSIFCLYYNGQIRKIHRVDKIPSILCWVDEKTILGI